MKGIDDVVVPDPNDVSEHKRIDVDAFPMLVIPVSEAGRVRPSQTPVFDLPDFVQAAPSPFRDRPEVGMLLPWERAPRVQCGLRSRRTGYQRPYSSLNLGVEIRSMRPVFPKVPFSPFGSLTDRQAIVEMIRIVG